MQRVSTLLACILMWFYQPIEGLHLQHLYYNLENAEDVDSSVSLAEILKCKDLCLSMKSYFPFSFEVGFHSHSFIESYAGNQMEWSNTSQPIAWSKCSMKIMKAGITSSCS